MSDGAPSGGAATAGRSPNGNSSSDAHAGGRRSGAGAGNNAGSRRHRGPARDGNPGASGGGTDGAAGIRFAPASPPGARTGSHSGDGVPRISWAAFRAPGIALAGSPGTHTPAAALPSTATAVLAASDSSEPPTGAAAAAPLARTGDESGASIALATTLILAGAVLRRTGRPRAAASY